jgi:hypothetical protein
MTRMLVRRGAAWIIGTSAVDEGWDSHLINVGTPPLTKNRIGRNAHFQLREKSNRNGRLADHSGADPPERITDAADLKDTTS